MNRVAVVVLLAVGGVGCTAWQRAQSGQRAGDKGYLPPEVIHRVVLQHRGNFSYCYEEGLANNPRLEGHVRVRAVIDRSGAVTSSADFGSDMPDPETVDCVVRAWKKLSFPRPEGKGVVTVISPMMFSRERCHANYEECLKTAAGNAGDDCARAYESCDDW